MRPFPPLARHLIVIMALIATPLYAIAQNAESERRLGLGAQVGEPTGLTAKYYARTNWSSVWLVSWNLERFLYVSSHISFERPIPDSPLHFFIGPGVFAFRGNSSQDKRIRAGISLLPGLNFFTGHFEVFLQTNPGLRFLPDLHLSLGGAVGLRYYF